MSRTIEMSGLTITLARDDEGILSTQASFIDGYFLRSMTINELGDFCETCRDRETGFYLMEASFMKGIDHPVARTLKRVLNESKSSYF